MPFITLLLYPENLLRVEVLAKTNSANYNGSEVNVNWSNRNTFRAAELLNLSVFGGLEVQVAGQNKGFNVYRVGGELSITWPRFISPIHIADSSAYVPRTRASVGYEYQNRSGFIPSIHLMHHLVTYGKTI